MGSVRHLENGVGGKYIGRENSNKNIEKFGNVHGKLKKQKIVGVTIEPRIICNI